MILNLHRSDPDNLGDQVCSVSCCFPELNIKSADIDSEIPPADAYIIGGGGLLHAAWSDKLISLSKTGVPLIAWGIGCNDHGTSTNMIWPKFLDDFSLVGLRDWENPWHYVPCPSCMHPAFNGYREQSPRYPYVLYEHFMFPLPIQSKGPRMGNRQPYCAFHDVLQFLASGSVVISNSFHGLYWAMLLNRAAVCFNPFSNRFFGFKNRPVYCDQSDWQEQAEKAKPYPEYLDDCRSHNQLFIEKAMPVIT